jgi:CRP-like cAMP-binding protein
MATNKVGDDSGQNRLLAALPAHEYERLRPHLERTSLGIKESLYEANQPISSVYFPCNVVISLLTVMEDGAAVEVGTIGNEGMVGLPIVLGTETFPGKAFCQIPGAAMRMEAQQAFREEIRRDGPLQDLVRRYTHTLFTQVAQSAACNRLHSIEERCARWLLMAHDRVGADEFALTQEFLSQMLGVRRPSVSIAAGMLQKAGFIRYRRGKIAVLDRPGLESASCECYQVIRQEFDRLFR